MPAPVSDALESKYVWWIRSRPCNIVMKKVVVTERITAVDHSVDILKVMNSSTEINNNMESGEALIT